MARKNNSLSQRKSAPRFGESGSTHDDGADDGTGEILRVRPNPVKGEGEVYVFAPVRGHMRVELADFGGRNVLGLFDGHYTGGEVRISFSVRGLPSDAYVCIVNIDGTRYHRLVMVD